MVGKSFEKSLIERYILALLKIEGSHYYFTNSDGSRNWVGFIYCKCDPLPTALIRIEATQAVQIDPTKGFKTNGERIEPNQFGCDSSIVSLADPEFDKKLHEMLLDHDRISKYFNNGIVK